MQVKILRPTKSAMQSGRGKSLDWVIEPILPHARQPEPLMGWIGAQDTLSELRNRLRFKTLQAAQDFATRQGWDVMIELGQERQIKPKNYLDNFRQRPLTTES
jgi:hypothetical protein